MTDMPVTQRALGVVRPALRAVLEAALEGRRLTDEQARRLADVRGAEHPALWATAAAIRDRGRPPVVTYSRKVFIPLTNLCRDICSYCTFARLDTDARAHTMSPDEILAIARGLGDDVTVSVKKTGVSLRRRKQFALVEAPSSRRVRLGLNLAGTAPTERLRPATGMCTHSVDLTDPDDVDDEIATWLRQAYQLAG